VAARIFDDPNLVSYRDRLVDDEERWHAIGCAGGIAIVLVVHTSEEQHGEEKIRIISARKASPRERALAMDHTPDHAGYGLTASVAGKPEKLLSLVSPGTLGHGGAFRTSGLIDPRNEMALIFLAQINGGSARPAEHAFTQIAESAIK